MGAPARNLEPRPAPPRAPRPGLRPHGDESRGRPRPARLHQVPDRRRDRQPAGGPPPAPRGRRARGDARPGPHVLRPRPAPVQGGAAPDRGDADQGPGARGPAPGGVPRRHEDGRARVAHHDRRRGRAKPDRHGSGGAGRGTADRGPRVLRPDLALASDDPPHPRLPRGLRARSLPGVPGAAPDLQAAGRDLRRGDGAPDGVAGRGAGREGLPGRGPGGGGVRRGCPSDPRQRLPHADDDLCALARLDGAARCGGRGGHVPGGTRDPRRADDGRRLLHLHDVPRLSGRPLLPDRRHRDAADRGPRRSRAHEGDPPRAPRGRGPPPNGGAPRGARRDRLRGRRLRLFGG